MPYSQQISPQSIAIDCLNSTKYLILRDSYGNMESATPQLRQELNRMASEHIEMAEEWFQLMYQKGWYMVPQARPEVVTSAVNHLQALISGINAMQSGQQQAYQQNQFR